MKKQDIENYYSNWRICLLNFQQPNLNQKMGNRGTKVDQEQLKEGDWQLRQKVNNIKIWGKVGDPNIQIQEYPLHFNDHKDFQRERQIHYLRKDHPYLVASKFFREQSQQQFCSNIYKVNLYIERIPVRLSNVTDIPFPDVLHLYNQALQGFQLLSRDNGCFFITEQNIGIRKDGVVKVWFNKDFQKSYPSGQMCSEEHMVRNILQIIENNLDTDFIQYRSVLNYIYSKNKSVNFSSAIRYMCEYAAQYNQGQIPNRLHCVSKAGGTDALMNQYLINNQYNASNLTNLHLNHSYAFNNQNYKLNNQQSYQTYGRNNFEQHPNINKNSKIQVNRQPPNHQQPWRKASNSFYHQIQKVVPLVQVYPSHQSTQSQNLPIIYKSPQPLNTLGSNKNRVRSFVNSNINSQTERLKVANPTLNTNRTIVQQPELVIKPGSPIGPHRIKTLEISPQREFSKSLVKPHSLSTQPILINNKTNLNTSTVQHYSNDKRYIIPFSKQQQISNSYINNNPQIHINPKHQSSQSMQPIQHIQSKQPTFQKSNFHQPTFSAFQLSNQNHQKQIVQNNNNNNNNFNNVKNVNYVNINNIKGNQIVNNNDGAQHGHMQHIQPLSYQQMPIPNKNQNSLQRKQHSLQRNNQINVYHQRNVTEENNKIGNQRIPNYNQNNLVLKSPEHILNLENIPETQSNNPSHLNTKRTENYNPLNNDSFPLISEISSISRLQNTQKTNSNSNHASGHGESANTSSLNFYNQFLNKEEQPNFEQHNYQISSHTKVPSRMSDYQFYGSNLSPTFGATFGTTFKAPASDGTSTQQFLNQLKAINISPSRPHNYQNFNDYQGNYESNKWKKSYQPFFSQNSSNEPVSNNLQPTYTYQFYTKPQQYTHQKDYKSKIMDREIFPMVTFRDVELASYSNQKINQNKYSNYNFFRPDENKYANYDHYTNAKSEAMHFESFGNNKSLDQNLQMKYSITQEQQYQVQWDPEILADLKSINH